MPSNRSTRKTTRNQARVPATAADVSAHAAPSAPDGSNASDTPAVPDTAATRALMAALAANPGATVDQLADTAKISRSAAFKALVALEKAAAADRHLGGLAGAKRRPDRWYPRGAAQAAPEEPVPADPPEPSGAVQDAGDDESVEPETPVASAEVPGTEDAASERVPASDGDVSEPRLGSGQLREMVLSHLRRHADQDFTPSGMGKVLVRSSGAIANACERLVAAGLVTQTSEKPRRYRAVATDG